MEIREEARNQKEEWMRKVVYFEKVGDVNPQIVELLMDG